MRKFGSFHQRDASEDAFAVSKHLSFGAGDIFAHSRVWEFDGVLDQGTSQECLAFFLAALAHAEPFSLPLPDSDGLYAEMCAVDGRPHDPDTGSSVGAMVQIAKQRKIFASALYTKSAAQTWSFIGDANGGPVGLAVPWFQDMMLTDDDGRLVLPSSLDLSMALGGHIVMLNGTQGDSHDFLGVNWFGPMFGWNGRFLLSYHDLCRLLDLEQSTVICPTKQHFIAK